MILLLMVGQVGADFYSLPMIGFCEGRPEVSGRALYWTAFGADLHYANSDEGRRILQPDYTFGYEIEGRYFFPGDASVISLSFLDLDISSQDLFEGMRVKTAQDYTGLDLQWTERFFRGTCFRIDLFGGIRYAAIDEKIHAAPFEQITKFRGGGPRFGVGALYAFAQGFGVAGHVALAAPIGPRKVEVNGTKGQVTAVLPNFDFRGATRLSVDFGCLKILGELGYEVRTFAHAFPRPLLFNPNGEIIADDTVTFAGPYVQILFRF